MFPIIHYDEKSQTILKEAKYHFAYLVLEEIAVMMKLKYSNLPFAVDFVIPVPLSKHRINWRGFNQSWILAKKINWQSKDWLEKHKNTIAQAKLHRTQRLKNLKETFNLKQEAKDKVFGKTIVLVDDVSTTGSTLQECAYVLKEAGAKRVYALVWAKD